MGIAFFSTPLFVSSIDIEPGLFSSRELAFLTRITVSSTSITRTTAAPAAALEPTVIPRFICALCMYMYMFVHGCGMLCISCADIECMYLVFDVDEFVGTSGVVFVNSVVLLLIDDLST